MLRELERRKADLNSITESSTVLQTLVEGSETSLEEKLCVLNAGWSRVRTWTDDWCNTLLVSCMSNENIMSRFSFWSCYKASYFLFS